MRVKSERSEGAQSTPKYTQDLATTSPSEAKELCQQEHNGHKGKHAETHAGFSNHKEQKEHKGKYAEIDAGETTSPSCAGGRGGGAAEGFEVACSVRPPGPGSKQTCPYLEANPARVEGQPGADARRPRPGSRVNPGRMRGEPGADAKRGGRRCPPEAAPPGVPASLLAGQVQPGCKTHPGRIVREAAAGLPSPSPFVADAR